MELELAPSELTLFPEGQTIVRGRSVAGNDPMKLRNDDNDANGYCTFLVPNDPLLKIVVDWTSTSGHLSPGGITCRVKSKMVHAGSFSQKIEAFNYDTGLYEESRTDVVNLGYQTRDLVLSGSMARYVRDADGQVKLRVHIRQTGPSTSIAPCSDFDLVNWIVND